MPKCYVLKYDYAGQGEIGIYAVYDDKIHFQTFNFNQPIDVDNPIKNQIDKAAVATFCTNNVLTPMSLPGISAGDVELVT